MKHRTRTLATLLAGGLVAAPVGCSSDEVDPTPGRAPITVSPEAGPSPSTGAATGVGTDALAGALAAVALAERRTGGRAVAVEDGDRGWEVEVVLNGRRLDVRTNQGATEVGAVERDGRIDAEERAALRAVSTDLAAALEIAVAEVPGTVEDAGLDDAGGGPAWKVTVDDGTTDREVHVDADGGTVLRVEAD